MSEGNQGNRQYPMHCKFDSEHGSFTNGVALRKHYDTEHADVYQPKGNQVRVRCGGCGIEMNLASFYSHKTRAHDADVTYTVVGGAIPRTAPAANTPGFCTQCGSTIVRKNIAAHLKHRHGITSEWGEGPKYWTDEAPGSVELVPAPITAPRSQRLPQAQSVPDPVTLATVLTADDIIMPAIIGMAHPGHVVPVAALGALFKWRDATALMLREVSGK